MRLIDDRTSLEVVSQAECLALLETQQLGRVAVNVDTRPMILPVNYTVDEGRVVFRTGDGTKFDAAVRGEFVAFEVDEIDAEANRGWSVVVTGVAEEVTDPGELDRIDRSPLRPWVPGPTPRVVRIEPATVSGRRIRPTD